MASSCEVLEFEEKGDDLSARHLSAAAQRGITELLGHLSDQDLLELLGTVAHQMVEAESREGEHRPVVCLKQAALVLLAAFSLCGGDLHCSSMLLPLTRSVGSRVVVWCGVASCVDGDPTC